MVQIVKPVCSNCQHDSGPEDLEDLPVRAYIENGVLFWLCEICGTKNETEIER